jgi:hypothetical protein
MLLLVGDCPNRQLVVYQKHLGWKASVGAEHRSVGVSLADGLCDLALGGFILAEGLHDWVRRAVPLSNYTLTFAL